MTNDSYPLMLEGDVAPPPGPRDNPVLMVHRRLRGRYPLAFGLAAVFAAIFAAAAFFAAPVTYRSAGLVHVAPTLTGILDTQRDESRGMFGYDGFVETQAQYLASRRVADRALDDPALKRAGWPTGVEGLAALSQGLDVLTPRARGGQVVTVAVRHTEPRAAQAAVDAILRSYVELYGEQGGLTQSERERKLVQTELDLDNRVQSLDREILRLSEDFGAETLEETQRNKVQQLTEMDSRLSAVALVIAEREAGGAGEEKAEEIDPAALPPEALAATDSELQRLIGLRDSLRADYASKSRRLGPRHPTMVRLLSDVESAEGQVEARAELVRRAQGPVGSPATGTLNMMQLAQMPLEQLRTLEQSYRRMRDQLERDARDIGQKRAQIERVYAQRQIAVDALNQTRRALENLRLESRSAQIGRVTIQAWGDLPVRPWRDKRKTLAAMGAMGGVGLGFGLVFLLSFVRGGFRYIDDLEHGAVAAPLLGTLPELTSGDGENDELAAASVHHLRNMLQLQRTRDNGEGAKVYAISSASAGEGKTSLTLSLGMSFAAAGHRTLLIDADLYGRGLTKSLGLGGAPGLAEAAVSTDLNGELHSTGFHNVWAMPAGKGDGFDGRNLSKGRMEALISRVREQFDVVILDTGPLLGSIEASLAAALVDGTVLMVTRGQDPKLVRACLKRVGAVGGMCVGLVFNRAVRADFERSVSTVSARSRAAQPVDPARQIGPPPGESSLIRALGGAKDEGPGPT